MIRPQDIPAPQQRYMPKKHGDIARRILNAAWQRYQETQFPEAERQRVGEIVAAELERRNPAADMDVLARYGLTAVAGGPKQWGAEGERSAVNVSTYNPHTDGWEGVGVQIPREVRVARSNDRLTANGRAARKPAPYGVTPENFDRHKREGTWADVVEQNESYFDRLAAESLPAETDAHFQRVMDLRKTYREQYQGFNGWIESHRGSVYPTWAEIAERFPFIAEYLAAVPEADRIAA